jgi:hypothetical protein
MAKRAEPKSHFRAQLRRLPELRPMT